MYCRNCGNEMHNDAVVCVKCGVPTGKGNNYCPNCGVQTNPEAVVCVNCGVGFAPVEEKPAANAKSKLAAGLLAIFLGHLGIHNFYLGYTGKAVAQLLITVLTCGAGTIVAWVWALIEGIQILTGKIDRDGKGDLLGE